MNAREVWAPVRHWLASVFVAPVRSGRPTPRQWPWGLRGVGLWGLAVFAGLLLLTVAAGWLRGHTPLRSAARAAALPALAVPVLLVALLTAVVLAVTASLHAHPVLRVLGVLLGVGAANVTVGVASGPVRLALVLVPLLGLTALVLARLGRRFHLVELVAATVLVAGPTLAGLALARTLPLASDPVPAGIEALLITFGTLATPALLSAGLAVPQLVTRFADALPPAIVARARPPRWLVWLGAAVGVVAVVGWLLLSLPDLRLDALPGSLLVALLTLAVMAPFALWRRRRARSRTGATAAAAQRADAVADDAIDAWAGIAWVVAVGLVLQMVPVVVLSAVGLVLAQLQQFELSSRAAALGTSLSGGSSTYLRPVVALAVLAWAWRRARRGRPSLVLPASAFVGVTLGTSGLVGVRTLGLAPWWSVAWLSLFVALGAVGVLVHQAAADRLREALPWLLGVAVLVVGYPLREVLADPLVWLLGSSTLAAVLVGLVWRSLTDAEFTRRETRWLPGPTRVLLFVANLVFAATLVAHQVLSRSTATGAAPDQFAEIGDRLLGTPLFLAVAALLLARAATAAPLPARAPTAPAGPTGPAPAVAPVLPGRGIVAAGWHAPVNLGPVRR